MSRLVDAKPGGGAFSAATPTTAKDAKEYLERVAKYVPSEIVAAYVSINGLVPATPVAAQKYFAYGNFFLCGVLTPIYLNRMAEPGKPKGLHLTIATIAFVVWAYAVAGGLGIFGPAYLNWYNAAIASIVLIVFTLVSGVPVPTEEPPPPAPEI